jgi:Lon protease-like protein
MPGDSLLIQELVETRQELKVVRANEERLLWKFREAEVRAELERQLAEAALAKAEKLAEKLSAARAELERVKEALDDAATIATIIQRLAAAKPAETKDEEGT